MGEYAAYNGQEIKIGTCEDMYYLRAEQRALVEYDGNFEGCRFRFPFPDEDGQEPGELGFDNYHRGYRVPGAVIPEGVEHGTIQFIAGNNCGLLCSLPCPDGDKASTNPFKVHKNGYRGGVEIVAQKLVRGKLMLIMRCGCCGAMWREEEPPQYILDALEAMAVDQASRQEPRPAVEDMIPWKIRERILEGYGITKEESAA